MFDIKKELRNCQTGHYSMALLLNWFNPDWNLHQNFSIFFTEGDADADKKEKVEDVENAEPVAS